MQTISHLQAGGIHNWFIFLDKVAEKSDLVVYRTSL